jgi:Tol biopolymer transport system component
MNVDGSGVKRLTDNPANDTSPVWSPDGKRIAFVSDRDDKEDEIYVMNAEDLSITRLTDSRDGDGDPAWSPDGQRIAYVSSHDNICQIYVMNADGSGATRLTNDPRGAYFPEWSPDGKQIAFSSWQDNSLEIYVMNADGSNAQRLTHSSDLDYVPVWSPDGQRILFVSGKIGDIQASGFAFSGSRTLYVMGPGGLFDMQPVTDVGIDVMNADGSNATNLGAGRPWADPAWSPDGQYITFVSTLNGNREICIMKADGSGVANLTNNQGNDFSPDW